jgi:hypothetical protein
MYDVKRPTAAHRTTQVEVQPPWYYLTSPNPKIRFRIQLSSLKKLKKLALRIPTPNLPGELNLLTQARDTTVPHATTTLCCAIASF